jgi:hypothetical protein
MANKFRKLRRIAKEVQRTDASAEAEVSQKLEKRTNRTAKTVVRRWRRWGTRVTAQNIVTVHRRLLRRRDKKANVRETNQTIAQNCTANANAEVKFKERTVRSHTPTNRRQTIRYAQRQQRDKPKHYSSVKKKQFTPRQQKRSNRQLQRQTQRIIQRKKQEAIIRNHSRATRYAQNTVRGIRKTQRGISAGLKAAWAALKSLLALLGAVGGVLAVLVIIVAVIVCFAASGLGIFFSNDSSSEDGMTLTTALSSISQEYVAKIQQIQSDNQPYDSVAIYGSKPSWKDVLAVYAATTTSDSNLDVITMDEEHLKLLSDTFWSMTTISASKEETTENQQVEVDVLDENGEATGEKTTEYQAVTTTRLKITVTGKSATDMESSMSADAVAQLTELLSSDNDALWTELLGSFSGDTGALDGDAAKVASYLLGLGFTKEATAGILGNIKAECGWNYRTIGVLDGLYHPYERNIGIFQFTTTSSNPNSNNEYWSFMRWCENNGLSYADLDAQLRWAFSGESGTSLWSSRWTDRKRYYSNAPGFTEDIYEHRDTTPEMFMSETNVSYAAYSWMAYYEGCTNGSGAHLDNRIAYAYEYYEQLMTASSVSLIWPTDSTEISSYYGLRELPEGVGSTDHKGIDIAAAEGTNIYAAASGTVTIAGYSDSAGNWIRIDHGNGTCTTYMHCSALYVSVGDTVTQGQTIAAVGSTGHSTGAHLDFRVLINGEYKNPLDYVSP